MAGEHPDPARVLRRREEPRRFAAVFQDDTVHERPLSSHLPSAVLGGLRRGVHLLLGLGVVTEQLIVAVARRFAALLRRGLRRGLHPGLVERLLAFVHLRLQDAEDGETPADEDGQDRGSREVEGAIGGRGLASLGGHGDDGLLGGHLRHLPGGRSRGAQVGAGADAASGGGGLRRDDAAIRAARRHARAGEVDGVRDRCSHGACSDDVRCGLRTDRLERTLVVSSFSASSVETDARSFHLGTIADPRGHFNARAFDRRTGARSVPTPSYPVSSP